MIGSTAVTCVTNVGIHMHVSTLITQAGTHACTHARTCLHSTGDMQELRASSRLFTVPSQTAVALLQFWVEQPGSPLINVSDSGTQAAQSRFYAWGSNVTDDPFGTSGNSTWYVPLRAGQLQPQAVPGNAATQWGELLDHSGMIPSVDSEGAVLNIAGTGYYRCVGLVFLVSLGYAC